MDRAAMVLEQNMGESDVSQTQGRVAETGARKRALPAATGRADARAGKRPHLGADTHSDESNAVGEDGEKEVSGKKEKAVKQKKIFLRVLKRIMEVPPNSPLLTVWRDSRTAKKTGKEIGGGYFGIEVMDVEEVDTVLSNLVPELDVTRVGSQSPQYTVADMFQITPEAASKYVVLQKGRYRLKNEFLPEEARGKVAALKKKAMELHVAAEAKKEEDEEEDTKKPTPGAFLLCAFCEEPIPCECLPHERQKKFNREGALAVDDQNKINIIGEAFQTIWEKVPMLQSNTIEQLSRLLGFILSKTIEQVERQDV